MKSLVALTGISVLLLAPAAHAADAAVDAVIQQFGAAFNKGDVAAARALHVASPVIVDEVAPYLWTGPKAFDSWLGDLGKAEAAEGKTAGQVGIGTPIREVVSGDRAYVVTPGTYSFKQKGMAMKEASQVTFVLAKEGSGWKIAAWTWTAMEAEAVK